MFFTFSTHKDRFKNGCRCLLKEIKEKSLIRYVGVKLLQKNKGVYEEGHVRDTVQLFV